METMTPEGHGPSCDWNATLPLGALVPLAGPPGWTLWFALFALWGFWSYRLTHRIPPCVPPDSCVSEDLRCGRSQKPLSWMLRPWCRWQVRRSCVMDAFSQ